ncbi:MarR family transcriptional regulator [Desulfuribacillus stibiiarsenatis]|uniref:MarR family transcriptional regulator n=1 Tax=Desulfuribacillus stibiiarsenatis TaxID=1390249 RepID=A0A1E5L8L0_9FIRM|nr:MarR family transcriptional regulator [Desulfuribacillus stibiiarsenatis]OEH86398.1 MarR family transcriptional regulator [Desulfuribacillus stibiiarsenatis]
MKKRKLFEQFVQFISSVHQVTNDMTKDVKFDEITPMQYKILEYIAVCQPVTLSKVSECLHISLPNASRELRKLMEKDLCQKHSDLDDKRKHSIRLTENGTKLVDAAFQNIELKFNRQIEALTEDELEEVRQALEVLQKKVFY